jgi:nitrous oxide reductase
MGGLTRRQLLGKSIGAATAGAVLVGGAGVLPRMLGTTAQAEETPSDGEPLVVYVHGGTSGELQLMQGDHETVVRDARLVSRLRAASGS